jgi:hypothetical protein
MLNLSPGNWYFQIVAVYSAGVQSSPSGTVSASILESRLDGVRMTLDHARIEHSRGNRCGRKRAATIAAPLIYRYLAPGSYLTIGALRSSGG